MKIAMKTAATRAIHMIGAGVCLLSLAGRLNVQAQNVTKLNTTTMNGGAADWSSAPTTSSVGEFGATPTATTLANMTLGGNLTLGGLQFDSAMQGPLTISVTGGYSLTNGASGINATNNATLNCSLSLGANQTWNVNSGNTMTVGGVISGANTLTLSGLGTVKLAGANTFTNTTTVTAGTLQLGSSLAFTNATFAQAVPLALSGSAIVDLNGYNAIVANINASASTATITDNGSGTGTDTLTITNNNNPNLTTVSALIKDGSTRHVAVVMANKQSATAQFNLGNANTFSGGLTLINGNGGTRLRINGTLSIVGSAGAITSDPFGTGPITIGQVATDQASILWSSGNNNQTLPNNILFNTSTYPTDPGIRIDSTGIVLSGTLTANNAPVTFCSEAASPGGAVSLTGQVTGASPIGLLLANDSGILTVTLNNGTASPNNYSGATVISANTTLSLGAANQIPDGSGYGNVTNNGTLSLNGNNETINGLSGAGTVDGVSGTPSFTVGGGNASGSFSGIIKNTAGTLALTKTGTGLQTLAGVNTYGGSTTVGAGTLQLQPVSAQSSPNPPSGSLLARYTFDNTLNDASGNGNNGAMSSGSATYVTGHFNQAISFTGANYVTVPYAASFGTYNSYTMSGWINLNAVPANNVAYGIFGTRGGTSPGDTVDIKVLGTGSGTCELHADVGSGSAWLNTAANYQANFAAGTWYMVTYVVNNTAQNVSIYVNGSLATTVSFSGTPLFMQSGQYLCIGNDYYQSSEDMNGAIDEVCVYGRALSAAEVMQLYNGVSTGTGPLPAGSAVSVASGAMMDLDGSAQTIASLSDVSGSGGVVTNSAPATTTLTLTPASGSTTFSGNLKDGGSGNAISFVVNGTGGTQVLGGASTYSGSTTVSGGTLMVNGNNSAATGAVAVNAGGTLGGSGTIGGNVTVANSATAMLYPNSAATLNLSGTLTIGGTSSGIKFGLSTSAAGANDEVVLANQNVTITGSPQITINSSGSLDYNDYVLINAGSGSISGSFNPTPVFTGATPRYSGQYSIVTSAHQVKLHYTPIALTVTANSGQSKVYGASDPILTYAVTSGSLVTGDSFSGALSRAAGSNVGNYAITQNTLSAGNYYAITFVSANFAITARPLMITAAANSKPYDGTTTAAATPTLTGTIQSGDTAPPWTESYSSKNVGTSLKLTPAHLVVNDGNSGNNYSYTYTPENLGTIAAATLTVSATGVNKVYDGTTTETVTLSDNRVAGDTVTDSYASANFADPNVGMGKPVSVNGISIAGADAGNYMLASTTASTSATISQANTFVGASSSENPSGYRDSISFQATLPVYATGSVVFSSTNGPISTNSVTAGSASSLSITNLPRGTNVSTVAYLGDGNYLGSTNTLHQIVTNHPPVAATMTVTRTAGLNLLLRLSDIATNWSDVDGDPVMLPVADFNLVTTNSVNLIFTPDVTNDGNNFVFTTNSFVVYTSGSNANDHFSYGISDGQGGTNIGYVNIVVNQSVTGTNSIVSIVMGNPTTLAAYGIPGYSYITERATNLAPAVWADIATNTAATNGVINVNDTFGDLGGIQPGSAFYQLKWQP